VVAAWVLIAFALAGWLLALGLWSELRQQARFYAQLADKDRDTYLGFYGKAVEQAEKMMDLYHERTGELESRIVSMRQEGFTQGGGALPQPVSEPFIPEIERMLRLMEPEVSAHSRRLAMEMREAGVEQGDILTRLEGGAGVKEMLEELERG
jgi:hypothetical protein